MKLLYIRNNSTVFEELEVSIVDLTVEKNTYYILTGGHFLYTCIYRRAAGLGRFFELSNI